MTGIRDEAKTMWVIWHSSPITVFLSSIKSNPSKDLVGEGFVKQDTTIPFFCYIGHKTLIGSYHLLSSITYSKFPQAKP